MKCPFCDSEQIELVSAWGGQRITSQVRCRLCGTYFEAVGEDFDARPDAALGPDREQRPA